MAQYQSNDAAPRGLTQQKAALYVGVSVNAFTALVAEGRMPPPVNIGGHLLWDRHTIDRYFDVAGAKTPDMKAWHELLLIAFPEYAAKAEAATPPQPVWSRKKYQHWYQMPEGPERDRRQAKEEAAERARIRKSPMGKWERVALWELYRRRGKLTEANLMRGVTFRTHEALHARGYVTVRRNEHKQVEYWQITDRGIAAVKEIPEEASPSLRSDK